MSHLRTPKCCSHERLWDTAGTSTHLREGKQNTRGAQDNLGAEMTLLPLCSLSQPIARPGHAHGGEEQRLFREEGQKRMSVVEMSQEDQLVWIDTKCSPKKHADLVSTQRTSSQLG